MITVALNSFFSTHITAPERPDFAWSSRMRASASLNPEGKADTLYFNAFTEDLFTWDNDLKDDSDRYVRLNETQSSLMHLKNYRLTKP